MRNLHFTFTKKNWTHPLPIKAQYTTKKKWKPPTFKMATNNHKVVSTHPLIFIHRCLFPFVTLSTPGYENRGVKKYKIIIAPYNTRSSNYHAINTRIYLVHNFGKLFNFDIFRVEFTTFRGFA